MIRYASRRFLTAIPLLLGVATGVFFLLHLAPGDPSAFYFRPGMSQDVLDGIRRDLGLDDPLVVQYFKWLTKFLRGDFGDSLVSGMPVSTRLAAAIPNTFLLASLALSISFVLGIVLGVVQAVRQNTLVDSALSGTALFFYSMPPFWLAIMLIFFFSIGADAWGWPVAFPPSGALGTDHEFFSPLEQLKDQVSHLVLPVLSLTLILTAGVARYVRAGMLEVIRQDYIRTARAKGLSESKVIFKHALRNGLIPVVTLFGVYFPFLLSGTVFVEKVFAWPGMGSLLVNSILQRDYPVVLAGTFVFAGMVILGNLLADLLYGVVDPRIREGAKIE